MSPVIIMVLFQVLFTIDIGVLRFSIHNFSGEIHKIKSKYGYDDKKCETYEILYEACDCFFE